MIIDQLSEISTPQGTDELPIERGTLTYKIKYSNLAGNKVSKAGDTMTGTLNMSSGQYLRISTSNIDPSTTPSSNLLPYAIRVDDKNGNEFCQISGIQRTNGNLGIRIMPSRTVNGAVIYNSLELAIDSSGNRVVLSSSATPWRSMLGLGTSGELPITIAQGGTGATTAEAAVENLGLGSLQVNKITINNGSSGEFSVPDSSRGFLISAGSNNATKDMFIYNVTSTGAVSTVKIGTSTGITLTTATNKITVANSGGSQTQVVKISF